MNFKSIPFIVLATAMLTVSCKKELEPQESSTDTTSTANVEAVQTQTAAPQTTPQMAPNGANPAISNTALPNTASPKPVQVAKGMNPAHGQPGHRCDIAVGAPLNSPASKMAPTPSPTKVPTQVGSTPPILNANPAPAAAQTTTAPGMNPPHGQAGHRCDIAVGAALPKE